MCTDILLWCFCICDVCYRDRTIFHLHTHLQFHVMFSVGVNKHVVGGPSFKGCDVLSQSGIISCAG